MAEYIYCREVERLIEPLSSRTASVRVGRWLGLDSSSFTVETLEIQVFESTSNIGNRDVTSAIHPVG